MQRMVACVMPLTWLTILALAPLCGCGKHRVVARPSAKVALEPEYPLHIMAQRYNELMRYLSDATGRRVEWLSSASSEGMIATIESRKPDIALVDPLHYVILKKACNAELLLKVLLKPVGGVGEPKATMKGLIIAHADGRTPSLSEIEGSIVAVPSRQVLFGFVAQAKLCKDAGINLNTLRTVVERREDRVVASVAYGRAKFGFVREGTLELLSGTLDLSKVKAICETQDYPNPCFVCLPEVMKRRAGVIRELKEALLKLNQPSPEHRRILELAGWAGITEAVDDKDYDVVRKLLEELDLPY